MYICIYIEREIERGKHRKTCPVNASTMFEFCWRQQSDPRIRASVVRQDEVCLAKDNTICILAPYAMARSTLARGQPPAQLLSCLVNAWDECRMFCCTNTRVGQRARKRVRILLGIWDSTWSSKFAKWRAARPCISACRHHQKTIIWLLQIMCCSSGNMIASFPKTPELKLVDFVPLLTAALDNQQQTLQTCRHDLQQVSSRA